MNGSRSEEERTSKPGSGGRGGIFFRVLAGSVAPALVLGIAGIVVARSLSSNGGATFFGTDFITLFVLATGLAILLALLITLWIDIGIRGQLGIVSRSLQSGRSAELRGLLAGDAWGAIGDVARDARQALAQSEEGSNSTEELKRLRQAAEELTEKIRHWQETEATPEIAEGGELSGLADSLRHLAARLKDRDRESLEAFELTRESIIDACDRIERTSREIERTVVEVSSLLESLNELRQVSGSLTETLRSQEEGADGEETGSSGSDPVATLRASLESGRNAVVRLIESTEEIERRALRAALRHAAGRLLVARGERATEAVPAREGELPGLRIEELGQLAGRCRDNVSALEALRNHLMEALNEQLEPAIPSEAELDAAHRRVDLTDRLEQILTEVRSKGERLAALAERANRQAAHSVALAHGAIEDLGGLTSRVAGEQPPSSAVKPRGKPVAAADAAADATAAVTPREKESTGASSPLRLLTREDVLADTEGEGSKEAEQPPGDRVGDV